jgi:two-component system, OmpR family, response regulator
VAYDATTLLWSRQYRDVVVLRWPEQARDVERLERLGAPRLLLVEPGVPPPESDSCLQDWLRLPAEDADVRVRLRALAHRSASHPVLPTVDTFGQLSYRGRALFLSPLDQRMAEVLIEHFGTVINDEEVRQRVWPDGATTQSLRVLVSRVRRRIAPLGLTISRVRGAGYVMRQPSGSSAPPAGEADD